MEFNGLWETLPPKNENIEIIKKDLSRGIAPHLPYFITGLDSVKEKISSSLSCINQSFQFCLIKGQYGNGKTNLLKYLEYYFERNPDLNVHCEVWRADVDKYDLNMFLLYIIQQSYSKYLKDFLQNTPKETLNNACNNYTDTFTVLKDYVDKILECRKNSEDIDNLIKLGTGAKYDKRSFDKFELEKFSNYNRHEVLAFFLNVFASNNFYLLFCIDELEKIEEKSKARFQSFLTSFRELIDMGSLIKGHMLMAAVTDSFASGMPIESYNPAFGRRISRDMLELKNLHFNHDLKSLATSLCTILSIPVDDARLDTIISLVSKSTFAHTNEVVIKIYQELSSNALKPETWDQLLSKAHLIDKLHDKEEELISDDVEVRLHSKFFAPMENYLNIISHSDSDYQIKAQEYQTIRKVEAHKSYVFLFTNDYESNVSRIRNVSLLFPEDKLVIFRPKGLSISHFDLQHEEIENIQEIIVYNPIELMALITLFVDDYDNDILKRALNDYLKGL